MLPLNPARIPAEMRRAQSLEKAGRLEDASRIYEAIFLADPANAEAAFLLGRLALREGKPEAAIPYLQAARKLKPAEPAVLGALAEGLLTTGQGKAALALYDPLIARAPKDARFRIEKAFLQQRLGDFEAAEKELRQALKHAPLRGDVYRMLLANRKLKPGDALIARMEKVHTDPRLQGWQRVQLDFALAKAMEDTGQTARVFDYLRSGNETLKAAYRYDITQRKKEIDGLIAAFSGHDFSPSGPGPADFAPIFVTGLPRSGTTLVEQILASHSQVTGAGEQPHSVRLAYAMLRKADGSFRPADTLLPAEIAGFGQSYAEVMRRVAQFDRLVTDKAIQSHLIMGLIKQAIPAAQFVVVRRDPRDLLYSIYKNLFAQGTHRYAYDMEDLAGYYASFLKMLDFWRTALPGGFHEIHYEDLVADPERQTRALIAAVGLDWEDACLSFHEGRRDVKTLSVQQVRQPIYRSSAAAWRKYEKDLAPLLAALEREGVMPDGA